MVTPPPKVAYLFPGQGAQRVGMGRDLYDQFREAREIFKTTNRILGFDLAALCFEGPPEELTSTKNAQPAILTVSIAALIAFATVNRGRFAPQATLGLSLGEYSALVAAESLAFEDAVKIVRYRGEFMEEASHEHPGTLVSIMDLPLEEVEQICRETGAQVANLNCPGQIVISGLHAEIQQASEAAKAVGAKRVIPLDVSGPFHSRWMDRASQRLKEKLAPVKLRPPRIQFVSNVTGGFVHDPDEIKRNLVQQVNHTTYWEKSVRLVASQGIRTFFEIGPGAVLKGLLKRIDDTLTVSNLDSAPSLTAV